MKRTNPGLNSKASEFASEQFLYLTTRGRKTGRSREIEIWFTHRQGRFYVIAEYPTSNWVQNLRADDRVQCRVADKVFNATARPLETESDQELRATIRSLSREKFGWGDGLVVELMPDTANV